MGGERECRGELDKLDCEEPDLVRVPQHDRDEVEGCDDSAGSLGRVKVSLLLVVVLVERRLTFRPQESSPYIVADFSAGLWRMPECPPPTTTTYISFAEPE